MSLASWIRRKLAVAAGRSQVLTPRFWSRRAVFLVVGPDSK
jgi:hypothetical protein